MRGAHRSDQPAHTHVVVAVKDLSRAKTRLAESLSASDRTDLVVAMLRDTLSVLVGARDTADPARITDVTVVTPDPVVASIAAECGVGHLPDPARRALGESGLNAALTDAERALGTAGGAIDVVALQADLPALRTAELLDALGQARRGGRSIVVDHTGTGTSALFACGPSTRLDPRFGTDSARAHIASGARVLDGAWPGLRQDVDTLDDLFAAARLGLGPATRAVFDRLGCTPGVRQLR
ncbi:2-phospho-L-lactate guanylyltransferase [Rhodococcus hoagii]|uniref:2-phospho-L-lactate guanylyltransferase n=2 Tax=Rhodococcus hoagii TaxID=43767 RepID=UPI000A116EA7|nr:2-phospho-L-lactate guanylyltransferase [Prescottella equi]MBM4532970.1 2-phospho-L-lactate guanylyltransferase [Prescottella equi]NKR82673.1 2-phospho-L-lactate guanylyltransferase [Prescottella equi]ORL00654.1 2-phospho-L-lactate guanylyltransferase [Prescottella equi]ORL04774.1 2-phospho-L-lactate guanylyltransferase [Prescottella equi]ORL79803.1 2-phospho-L-lactate guanylyltransferase [Prescottella equi]